MRILIISGTVFGTSEEVAYQAQEMLESAGIGVSYNNRLTYSQLTSLEKVEAVLFVTSTTGMGEMPDALAKLIAEIQANPIADWYQKPYAVIALGDESYGETYCAGGEQVKAFAEDIGMLEILPMLRLDGSATVTPELDAEPWIENLITQLLKK